MALADNCVSYFRVPSYTEADSFCRLDANPKAFDFKQSIGFWPESEIPERVIDTTQFLIKELQWRKDAPPKLLRNGFREEHTPGMDSLLGTRLFNLNYSRTNPWWKLTCKVTAQYAICNPLIISFQRQSFLIGVPNDPPYVSNELIGCSPQLWLYVPQLNEGLAYVCLNGEKPSESVFTTRAPGEPMASRQLMNSETEILGPFGVYSFERLLVISVPSFQGLDYPKYLQVIWYGNAEIIEPINPTLYPPILAGSSDEVWIQTVYRYDRSETNPLNFYYMELVPKMISSDPPWNGFATELGLNPVNSYGLRIEVLDLSPAEKWSAPSYLELRDPRFLS